MVYCEWSMSGFTNALAVQTAWMAKAEATDSPLAGGCNLGGN
jgi:hypothetical protein